MVVACLQTFIYIDLIVCLCRLRLCLHHLKDAIVDG